MLAPCSARKSGRDAGLMRCSKTFPARKCITNLFRKFVHNFLKKSRVDYSRQERLGLGTMNGEKEPGQQTIRKIVGRPQTVSRRLAHLEDLTVFLKKYAPIVFSKMEGDAFPVRKTVGRPRQGRS